MTTPGAIEAMLEPGIDPSLLLLRRSTGDWEDLDAHDKRANAEALVAGSRLLSAYQFGDLRIRVITEAQDDRALASQLGSCCRANDNSSFDSPNGQPFGLAIFVVKRKVRVILSVL